ncbi:hypothetical protein L0222_32820 [bacterium]|nr:hypothetical protein [bacterium]
MSPFVAFIEVIWSWLFGDLELYRQWIYFVLAVAAFSLPVIVALTIGFRTQVVTIIICLLLSMGIARIHPCNPQMYDLLYSVLVFGVILLLESSSSHIKPFFAGLALGLLELTRPFFLFMLPVFLIFAYFKLRGTKRFLIFLLPFILTSGLWHLKLLVFNNGQIVWSNCTGFNLATVWLQNPPIKEFSEEPPLKAHRWENLNSELHQQNSQKLKRVIFSNWINDPLRVLSISLIRIYAGGRYITFLYDCFPKHWILPVYNLVATTIYVLSFLSVACWLLLVVYLKPSKLLLNYIFFVVLAGCLTAAFNAIGQAGEEARLVVSCLPSFACLPALWTQRWR